MTAALLCLGFVAFGVWPAMAQTDRVYTGVTPPVIGNVLSSTGQAPAAAMPLQVGSGAVSGTSQGSSGGLAFTGLDIILLGFAALVATTIGIVLTRLARARTAT